MKSNHIAALALLYRLAHADRPADLALVADNLGVSCTAADALLAELEAIGLVDAERVRLTLAGLALAVSHGAGQRRRSIRAA